MPFPPGVGGRSEANSSIQNYDVITADRAIDESNVGNRMLRNMGWQEGLVHPLPLIPLLFSFNFRWVKFFHSLVIERQPSVHPTCSGAVRSS